MGTQKDFDKQARTFLPMGAKLNHHPYFLVYPLAINAINLAIMLLIAILKKCQKPSSQSIENKQLVGDAPKKGTTLTCAPENNRQLHIKYLRMSMRMMMRKNLNKCLKDKSRRLQEALFAIDATDQVTMHHSALMNQKSRDAVIVENPTMIQRIVFKKRSSLGKIIGDTVVTIRGAEATQAQNIQDITDDDLNLRITLQNNLSFFYCLDDLILTIIILLGNYLS